MPLDIVSMAIYVTLEGKIPRTPYRQTIRTIIGIMITALFEEQMT